MIKTNDIKKGRKVLLANGWFATIEDNGRGNTRLATVYGHYTEMGSVYSHDIKAVKLEGDPLPRVQYLITADGFYETVEHTPAQLKLKAQVNNFFGGI